MSETLFLQLREAAVAGALVEAARGLERLDAQWPQPQVAALRAWVALAQDDLVQAARWLALTFERDPDHVEALTLAVDLALRRADSAAALEAARRLVELTPRSALAQHNLAVVLRHAGVAGANEAWARALALDPQFAPARSARAWALLEDGDVQGASEDFRRLLQAAPRDVAATLGAGLCAHRLRSAAAALQAFDRAVALAPDDPDAWRGRADALEQVDRIGESIAAREHAAALARHAPAALEDLAMGLSRAGEVERARAAAERAASTGSPLGAWLALQLLPVVYRDAADLEAWRAHWRDGLAAFAARAAECTPAQACAVLTTATSFHRHYLDDDLLDDQRQVGALLELLARRALPEPQLQARAHTHRRRRIGFASAHWGTHTVAQLFAAFPAGLDRERFEVIAVHLGSDATQCAQLRTIADQVLGPHYALGVWHAALTAADLDALIWLDIGMDGTTQALSALRWAPRQYALWGHPVTTGLSTIDGFISAAGMEPAAARARYTEPLHLLPGIGISAALPKMPAVDVEPGLLLCAQGVHKLLPVHDALFARILADAPGTRLELLPGALPPLRDRLLARVRRCLDGHGVDPQRVQVHQRLDAARFAERVAAAHLVLDSIGWSGGRTSLQALSAARPVLTLPGAGLRSRHTLSMLDALGLAAPLVAADADDYVTRAVALARDRASTAALSATIAARCGVLDAEGAPRRALEVLLSEPDMP